MVGANIRVYPPDIQPKPQGIYRRGIEYMDPHTVYHIKGDVIWALGPKAKHEIMRGQWGRELKDVRLKELLTLFKKIFLPARNVFHSRAQFFNMKQDDNETLDEYWKRLVDIERKCDFNNITAEEIITYKFAATIKDKRACSIFLKIIDDSFPYFAHEISKVDLTRVFISHWCRNFQEVKLND